jgi:Protein of unknown function (DUF3239)
MERTIGEQGEILNQSVASRAVNIDPNMRRVRRYDIYHKRYKSLLKGWGLSGLTLLVAGLALCWFQHPVWGGVLIALSVPVLFIAARIPQTLKGDAYRSGLLIPGIVTNLSPLTVTCVTDARTGEYPVEAGEPMWGVREVLVEELPLHASQLGEQVPCVSLFGETNEEGSYYTNFEPRPLSWGTENARIIEQARQAIDNDEWLILPTLARAFATHSKNDNDIAFFDLNLQPVTVATSEATDAPTAP